MRANPAVNRTCAKSRAGPVTSTLASVAWMERSGIRGDEATKFPVLRCAAYGLPRSVIRPEGGPPTSPGSDRAVLVAPLARRRRIQQPA